jgi:hypothetical protein
MSVMLQLEDALEVTCISNPSSFVELSVHCTRTSGVVEQFCGVAEIPDGSAGGGVAHFGPTHVEQP